MENKRLIAIFSLYDQLDIKLGYLKIKTLGVSSINLPCAWNYEGTPLFLENLLDGKHPPRWCVIWVVGPIGSPNLGSRCPRIGWIIPIHYHEFFRLVVDTKNMAL